MSQQKSKRRIMERRAQHRRQSQRRLIIGGVIAAVVVAALVIVVLLSTGPKTVTVTSNYEGFTQEVDRSGAMGLAIGSPDAPVTFVEYSDFSCHYCRDLHSTIHDLIVQYARNGQLRVIYKPITFVNPTYSDPAARAAICAAGQGKGWEMIDEIWSIFEQSSPGAYSQERFAGIASALGLDVGKFNDCFNSAQTTQDIQAVLDEAQAKGISGTPTMFLNGQQVNFDGTPESVKRAVEAAVGG